MGVGLREESFSPISLRLPAETATVTTYESNMPNTDNCDTEAAQAALLELIKVNQDFRERKNLRNKAKEESAVMKKCESQAETTSPAATVTPPQTIKSTSTVSSTFGDSDAMFSDDDSLLLRYCEESGEVGDTTADLGHKARLSSPPAIEAPAAPRSPENIQGGFESDDSFEFFMSQVDETEVMTTQVTASVHKVDEDKKRPLETFDTNLLGGRSPNSRASKRYKSNDESYGSYRKGSTSLRRIQSSPVIPAEPSQPRLCTQEEIELKKAEAKRRLRKGPK